MPRQEHGPRPADHVQCAWSCALIIMPGMLPHFLDSMVQLIARTSTDLPPDVRTAMGLALKTEEPATRGAGADDHRAEHRSGRELRGADLPGHRDADLRSEGARRRESDLDEAADQERRRR